MRRPIQTKLQYGSAGGGSGSHVCALLLDGFIGAKITHVPYRGAGPAMQDLIAGRLDYMAEQISTAFPQIEAGTVKAIAMMGPNRVLGAARSAEREGRRAARFRLRRLGGLGAAAEDARRDRAQAQQGGERDDRLALVRERFAAVGVTIIPPERRSPEYLAKYIPSEIEKWAGPIKASGATGE